MRKSLRIALAQINVTVGDLAGNRAKILEFVARAKKQQADVVLFPELVVSGYPPEDLLYKEKFVPDNIKSLRASAPEIKGIVAIVGFVDADRRKNLFNAAAVIANGNIRGIYHKHALPNYGVFDEKRYFQEGRQNFVCSLSGIKAGISICEDVWCDQGPYVAQVRAGAKILFNLSSSPFDYSKFELRRKLLVSVAKKNKVFICYTNLVGGQDELVFDGGSLVIDPQGVVIASGKQFVEDLIFADLEIESKGTKKGSILKTVQLPMSDGKKRPISTKYFAQQMSQIERVHQALVLGTRDYVRKNGFQKVVVGLSGGIDSTLVAAIARDAVGKENVIGVTMPSTFTSEGTHRDAKKAAQQLGIRFMEIPIQEIFQSYLNTLQEAFRDRPRDVTEENIQARIRGNILMAFSNKFGWLVLTTGNKSEVAVGYCTLYGDMSGGFAVIKDVPKTMVYELAASLNRREPGLIPQSIIDRAPTAELRENQKDQDTLPPYDILDELLREYVEEHRALMPSRRVNKDLIRKIVDMIDHSEYKRRQAPPGIKITTRAFGKDWRLPLTNKYSEFK